MESQIIKQIDGTAHEGAELVVHLSGNGGRGSTFKPKVLAAIPGQELRWLGKLGLGGLFDGEHFFIFTTNDDGTTRLTQGEISSGLLPALMKHRLEESDREDAEAGARMFNRALKNRVETTGDSR
ncbi:MAG TPA: SRPBCC domain-containing protein [Jatrophihabitantaceae bacterium]|nr:SRPBCC domain-containing protein [Jatrophihabitantaceae bacterium]